MNIGILDVAEIVAIVTAVTPLYRMTITLFKDLSKERSRCRELEERVASLEVLVRQRKTISLRTYTRPKDT